MSHSFVLSMLLAASAVLAGAEPCPAFGPSIGYEKGGPQVSISGLRGKAVLVVFGQSWCPKCNVWTPELLPQIEKAWAGRAGVALVFVKTDGDASSGSAYLTGHGGDPSRWFVVGDADAAWTKQVMKQDQLWQFAIIDPDGAIAERGEAGRYFTGGNAKRYVLGSSKTLTTLAERSRTLLPKDQTWPTTLTRAVQLAEAGCFADAMAAAASAPKADSALFRETLLASIDTRVDEHTEALAGQEAGRFQHYMALRDIANGVKGSAAAKKATEAMRAAAKDKSLQREIAAEKAWLGGLAKINTMPVNKRAAALEQAKVEFAKVYGHTWFASTVGAAPP